VGDGISDLEALLATPPEVRRSCAVCISSEEIREIIATYGRMRTEGRTQWSVKRLYEKILKPMNPPFRVDVVYRHLREEHGTDEP